MQNRMRRHQAAGFSLIELMAVIVIIGLLGTGVTVMVVNRVAKARVERVKMDLTNFEEQIQSYMMSSSGRPPETLSKLVPEYIKEVPKDSWDNAYDYKVSGTTWSITSYGADSTPGGEDDDADQRVSNARTDRP